MSVTLRSNTQTGPVSATTKGSALTHSELDANFQAFMASDGSGSSNVTFVQSGSGAVARPVQDKLREVQVSITDYLPAGYVTDGTVDYSTYITKGLTYLSGLISVLGGGGRLYFPPGVWGIGSQIVVPPQIQLVGQGRITEIKAISGTFPTSTALIRLGQGTAFAFNTRVENLAINCNNISGSIGIYGTDLQEQSGGRDVLVRAFGTNGIKIDGGAGQGCADYFFEDIECLTNTGGAGCVGIWIKGAQSWKSLWKNITINATGASGGAGDHAFRIGDGSVTVNSPIIEGLHMENFTNGIKIEANSQNVLIVQADSLNCTNTVTNASTGRVVALSLLRSGGTNTINDTANSVTITNTVYPMYVAGEVVDFVSGVKSRGTLTQTGQSKLVGSVASPVQIDKSAAAVGTGRMTLFVGDGTGGTVADDNYVQSLNTDLHFWGGASGTTLLLTLALTGAIKGLITSNGPVGTFTASAAASTTVNNTIVTASSLIFVFPTNAAGATLMQGANSLYISAKVAGTSFTVATAGGGSAAGTETFNYLVLN